MSAILKRLSVGELVTLFLIVAFPIHAWSIFMILTFALFESAVIFIIVWLLSLLLPSRWKSNKTLAAMGTVFISVSIWAILNQLYFFYHSSSLVKSMPQIYIGLSHPVRMFYLSLGVLFLVVLASVVGPIFFVDRNKKYVKATMAFFDRLIILSGLYIFLDVISIVIVIIRNV